MIEIKETTNQEEIKQVLYHPEILPNISEDNISVDSSEDINLSGNLKFFASYYENKLSGLFLLETNNEVADVHITMLPEYRKEIAYETGCAFINKCFNELGIKKLTAIIPSKYTNVLKFAQKVGFKIVNKTKDTYISNGTYYDDYYLELENGLSS